MVAAVLLYVYQKNDSKLFFSDSATQQFGSLIVFFIFLEKDCSTRLGTEQQNQLLQLLQLSSSLLLSFVQHAQTDDISELAGTVGRVG
uniref:Uncharacterized protein n=1 Tax=Rhipicephalus appendiculatus TaxID=34631 RepID=A0A131YDD3_RHIAP